MIGLFDIIIFVFLVVFVAFISRKRRNETTPLRGPPSPSLMYGWSRSIFQSSDSTALYEAWAREYGPAYVLPVALGRKRVVIYDPQAISHCYARETVNYMRGSASRNAIADRIGKGIIWSEGEDHKRQRKILAPAFTSEAIKSVSDVFYDSAYKAKTAWDNMFESTTEKELVIDVQKWMNNVSLDTIGIAGFSHDFGSLAGGHTFLGEILSLSTNFTLSTFAAIQLAVSPVFPILSKIPSRERRVAIKASNIMGKISNDLLERSRSEVEGSFKTDDRSLLGILLRAEEADSAHAMSKEEVESQMKTLIFAGYVTSSISLTWALARLADHPEIQTRLREEMRHFDGDLTYEQLWSPTAAPYLDAVVKETLRLHAPVTASQRVCAIDDVVPLSQPVTTLSGKETKSLNIAAGTPITIPISAINRSKLIWGPDALEFKPERWLDNEKNLTERSKELQGFHHLLTFLDGPRTCLGKGFAVTEIKAVLSVLIRHYSFRPRDGPSTKYEVQRFGLARPKIVGEQAGVLPLKLQRLDE